MPRETIYNSVILKKQPYGEGDEILTLFTEENGKVRALAKSTKFSKSKLQYALQTCFFTRLTLTQSGLPKIIGAEVVNAFPNIRENLEAAKIAFYALEVTLKATPDEQKNERLFHLLVMFFTFLDLCKTHADLLDAGLAKFKIQFLQDLGLGISIPPNLDIRDPYLGFSASRGGFISGEDTVDFISVTPEIIAQFSALEQLEFSQLIERQGIAGVLDQPLTVLQDLLSTFIRHQLERDIRSERFLA